MEKELEKVKDALEDFGKKVVDAVKKGKGEADKVTRIAQVRIEISSRFSPGSSAKRSRY